MYVLYPDSMTPITGERSYLLDKLIPSSQISIIYGPSGAGKTTLALQLLRDWSQGIDVWGEKSHPVPFVFLSCHRSQSALEASMARLGLSPSSFPATSLESLQDRQQRTFAKAVEVAQKLVPRVEFIVMDDFATLCPGKINDYKDVETFLRESQLHCQRHNLTVLGTLSGVKARQGDGYESVRDRLHGSTAWHLADTKITIEPIRPKDHTDPSREISFMPQNFPGTTRDYVFDANGWLVERSVTMVFELLDKWLFSLGAGTLVATRDILDAATQLGISRRTAFRWKESQVLIGMLTKIGHGQYRLEEVPEEATPSA